jgi:acyl-CoA thioesterase I
MWARSCAIIFLILLSNSLPAAQQIKVSCIGNSITSNSTYVTTLQKLLGATAYKVENDGVSGTTLLKKGDHPYWVEGKFKQVFTLQPNIVTIKLGTNDTKPQNWDSHYGEFKRDYLAMIDTLNTLASKPKIWIVLPVPIFANSFGIRDSALKKMLPILKEIGQERGLPVIDANTPLQNFQQYFSDGVHPGAAGADTIAQVIYRALKSAVSADHAPLRHFSNTPSAIMIPGDNRRFSVFFPSAGILRILDLQGSVISMRSFQSPGRHDIAFACLPPGYYMLQLECGGQPAPCLKTIVR